LDFSNDLGDDEFGGAFKGAEFDFYNGNWLST